jgi:hypothetical protein
MARLRTRRRWVWLATTVVILVAVVALNWQVVGLGLAAYLAERRPALLADAEWDKPATARTFLSRFGPGTSEGELLEWLNSNDFTVDRDSGRANRLISSLPCNERVEITWSKAPGDAIVSAEARVSQAGCL